MLAAFGEVPADDHRHAERQADQRQRVVGARRVRAATGYSTARSAVTSPRRSRTGGASRLRL